MVYYIILMHLDKNAFEGYILLTYTLHPHVGHKATLSFLYLLRS